MTSSKPVHAAAANTSPSMNGRPQAVGALGALACGLVHGVLCWLGEPPISVWAMAFAAVMPLVLVITRSRLSPSRAALCAAAGTLPYWAYTQRWVFDITSAGYGPMLVLQAFWTWLFVWLSMRVFKSRAGGATGLALMVPLVWTGVEFVRAEVAFTGYSWGMLGYPLIDARWLAAPGAALGISCVSFLACVPAGAIAEGIARRPGYRVRGLVTLGLAVLAFVVSALGVLRVEPVSTITVGVVQTNLPQDNKLDWTLGQARNDMERYLELTARAAGAERTPDVIVWPETMVPGGTLSPQALGALRREKIVREYEVNGRKEEMPSTWFADQLLSAQQSLGVPMLVGAEGTDGFRVEPTQGRGVRFMWDDRYNSVFQIDQGALSATRYDKKRLTPFGEFFPYIRHWPWLQDVMLQVGARGMKFNLSEGTAREVFQLRSSGSRNPVRVVTPICFEVTDSGYMRGLVYEDGRRRADVVISPTNDGWFGVSNAGREHNMLIARWRCVELGTPMVRAANTGVSAFIDETGRVVSRGVAGDSSGHNVDGVLVDMVRFAPGAPATLYGRIGNIFGWTCLGGSVVLGVAAFWSRRPARSESRK
jgi:apolipoprotein N-acyltransferase